MREWTEEEAELVGWKFDEYGIEEDSVGYGPEDDEEYQQLCNAFGAAQAALSKYARDQLERHGIDPEGCW